MTYGESPRGFTVYADHRGAVALAHEDDGELRPADVFERVSLGLFEEEAERQERALGGGYWFESTHHDHRSLPLSLLRRLEAR